MVYIIRAQHYNFKQAVNMSRSSLRQVRIPSSQNQSASKPKQHTFDPSMYANKNLPVDDVLKLKECFDIFDYDKSQSISSQELINSIKALGLENQAGKILQIVQMHTSQEQMNFQVFLQIFGFSAQSNSQKSLKQLFQIFDKNKVGSFSAEQFAEVCENVGERFSQAQIEQMIDLADKDRDGRINFEQFVNIITKEYPSV